MDIKNKSKDKITRADIANLLKSIGQPGDKRDEKIKAVKDLELTNPQNIDVVDTLKGYSEF